MYAYTVIHTAHSTHTHTHTHTLMHTNTLSQTHCRTYTYIVTMLASVVLCIIMYFAMLRRFHVYFPVNKQIIVEANYKYYYKNAVTG